MALLDTGLFEYGKTIRFKTESIKFNVSPEGIENIKTEKIENFEEDNTSEIVEKDTNLENGDTPAEEEHGLGDPRYDDEASNTLEETISEDDSEWIEGGECDPTGDDRQCGQGMYCSFDGGGTCQQDSYEEQWDHTPSEDEEDTENLPQETTSIDTLIDISGLADRIGNDPLIVDVAHPSPTPATEISDTSAEWEGSQGWITAKAACDSKVKAGSSFTYSNHPTNMGLTNNWACREKPAQTETIEETTPEEETPATTATTTKGKSGGGGGGGGGGKSNMAKIDKLWAKRLKKKGVKTETGPTEAEREMESNPLGYILKYVIGSAVVLGGGFFAYKQEYHTKAIKKIKSLRKKK